MIWEKDLAGEEARTFLRLTPVVLRAPSVSAQKTQKRKEQKTKKRNFILYLDTLLFHAATSAIVIFVAQSLTRPGDR